MTMMVSTKRMSTKYHFQYVCNFGECAELRAKCKLLCCMCHENETIEENTRANLLAASNVKYNQTKEIT